MEHPHNIYISHIHSIHCWEVTGSLTHKACLLRLRYRDLLASAVLRAGGETLTLQWRARQQLVTAGLTLHAEYCHGGVPTCSDSLPGSPQYSYSLPRRDANLGSQRSPDRPLTTRPRATPPIMFMGEIQSVRVWKINRESVMNSLIHLLIHRSIH